MPLRNGKTNCTGIWELKTDPLTPEMTLLLTGFWSLMGFDKINLVDTFVSLLESLGQEGAIDQFSPSANFYHHLCQVDWCSWQRSPLRQLMNKPMRIFNNRKACGLGKLLPAEGITQSLCGKSLVTKWLWVSHTVEENMHVTQVRC